MSSEPRNRKRRTMSLTAWEWGQAESALSDRATELRRKATEYRDWSRRAGGGNLDLRLSQATAFDLRADALDTVLRVMKGKPR